MGEVIIVTGPPGAGKSTVSRLVADSFGSSVLIPGDWFFGLWHSGAIDPWLPQALPQTSVAASAAAAAVGAFALADCQVVYDGFIPPRDLPRFAAASGLSALHYAVILPPVTTCVNRVTSRTGHGFTSADATRAMHRDFAQATLDARHLVTDAGIPPSVARQILDRLGDGSILWTAPSGGSAPATQASAGSTHAGYPVAGPGHCRLTARVSFDFQAAYDELNPADDDYRFYAAPFDLGCGTGTLARMLASGGATVTGVDPDPDMLRVARAKDPDGRVDWRLGYSDVIEPGSAELAVMSGHVAQVFTDDRAWLAALRDLHRALVPGGLLAFESRNPAARKWEDWTRELTLRTVETPDGPVEFWHETVDASLPLVSYDTLTRNLRTGQATVNRDVLAFRDEPAIRTTLEHAGFDVQHVYGDWDRTAPAATSPELIVIARRPRH